MSGSWPSLPTTKARGSVKGMTLHVTVSRLMATGRARPSVRQTRPRPQRSADRRPSGRERHDEKITVYLSPDELIDLERARLALRQDHGMAVDRGRIVREALALVLAELEAKGDGSTLVRRLRDA